MHPTDAMHENQENKIINKLKNNQIKQSNDGYFVFVLSPVHLSGFLFHFFDFYCVRKKSHQLN